MFRRFKSLILVICCVLLTYLSPVAMSDNDCQYAIDLSNQKPATELSAKELKRVAEKMYFDLGLWKEKRTFDYFFAAANRNNVQAMSILSYLYSKGLGVEPDIEYSKLWFDKTLKSIRYQNYTNNADLAFYLTYLFRTLEQLSSDSYFSHQYPDLINEMSRNLKTKLSETRDDLLMVAIRANHSLAITRLGVRSYLSESNELVSAFSDEEIQSLFQVAIDTPSSYALYEFSEYSKSKGLGHFEALEQAAENCSTDAMIALANELMSEGKAAGRAIYWLEKAMELGNSESIFELARQYHQGKLVNKDLKKAHTYFKLAADMGNASALLMMARLNEDGTFVENVSAKSIDYLISSAEFGDTDAMNILGHALLEGMNIPQNVDEGLGWLEKASLYGDDRAMLRLYQFYSDANKDDLAVFWLRKSAEHQNPMAIGSLALEYIYGEHIPQDLEEAAELTGALKQDTEAFYFVKAQLLKSEKPDFVEYRKLLQKAYDLGGQDVKPYVLEEFIYSSDKSIQSQLSLMKRKAEKDFDYLRSYVDILECLKYHGEILKVIGAYLGNFEGESVAIQNNVNKWLELIVTSRECCDKSYAGDLEYLYQEGVEASALGLAKIARRYGDKEQLNRWLNAIQPHKWKLDFIKHTSPGLLSQAVVQNFVDKELQSKNPDYELVRDVSSAYPALYEMYSLKPRSNNSFLPSHVSVRSSNEGDNKWGASGGGIQAFIDIFRNTQTQHVKISGNLPTLDEFSLDKLVWLVKLLGFNLETNLLLKSLYFDNLSYISNADIYNNKRLLSETYLELAIMNENGYGTPVNLLQAKRFYHLAAMSGNIVAFNELAISKLQSSSAAEVSEAHEWFLRADESLSVISTYNLARLKIDSNEMEDIRHGWRLMEKAANAGLPHAKYMIELRKVKNQQQPDLTVLRNVATHGLPEAMAVLHHLNDTDFKFNFVMYVLNGGAVFKAEEVSLLRRYLREGNEEFLAHILEAKSIWAMPLFPLSSKDVPLQYSSPSPELDLFMLDEPLNIDNSEALTATIKNQKKQLKEELERIRFELKTRLQVNKVSEPQELYQELEDIGAKLALYKQLFSDKYGSAHNLLMHLGYRYAPGRGHWKDSFFINQNESCEIGNTAIELVKTGAINLGLALLKYSVTKVETNLRRQGDFARDNFVCFTSNRQDTWHRTLASVFSEKGDTESAIKTLELLKKYQYGQYTEETYKSDKQELEFLELNVWERAFLNFVLSNTTKAELITFLNANKTKLYKDAPEIYQYFSYVIKLNNNTFVSDLESSITSLEAGSVKQQVKQTLRGMGLNERSAAIYYFFTDRGLQAIVAAKNYRKLHHLDITEGEVRKLVSQFRAAIQKGGDVNELALKVGSIVFSTIQKDLVELKIDNVFLSLDGVLRYVPFSALMINDQFIVEKYNLAIITPTNGYNRGRFSVFERSLDKKASLFGLTNQVENYAQLVYAEDEVNQIEKVHGLSAVLYTGSSFNHDAVTKAFEQGGGVIHISTHFSIDKNEASHSYLVFGDGSKVTMKELISFSSNSSMDEPVDLFILSVCNSALPLEHASGEEFENLAIAVQRTGANNVVATLWQLVDEASIPTFMKRFYENLTSQNNPSYVSLREAQLSMLNSKNYAHPKYWSQYVVFGSL